MKRIDLRKRAEMVDYLSNHFRYDTLNPWNGQTSWAKNVKIYKVIPYNLQDRVYELMESEGFYDILNGLLSEFNRENPGLSVGFNGRSGGYLVLYENNRGGSVDDYYREDFEAMELRELRDIAKKVLLFDELCDSVVNETIYMAEHAKIKEVEYTETKSYKEIEY